jgi:hypothetical protein
MMGTGLTIKCLHHNKVVLITETRMIHKDGTLCYSRLLSTPYENKEPDEA